MQIDHMLRLGQEMIPRRLHTGRRAGGPAVVGSRELASQRGEGPSAQQVLTAGKEMAAGHIQREFIQQTHDRSPIPPPEATLERVSVIVRVSSQQTAGSTVIAC